MPYGKYKKYTPRKPAYKRKQKSGYARRSKYIRKAPIMSVPSGMPLQRRARLRYVDTVELNGLNGNLGVTLFRANSCFDPDFSLGGHQPLGYDEWSNLFNHYCVIGSKISCSISPASVEPEGSYITGVYLSDASTVPYATFRGFIEAKKGTWRRSTNQNHVMRTKSHYGAKKFFSITDVKDNTKRIGAQVTANPTDDAFFIVWIQAAAEAGSIETLVTIVMDFIVDFSEPKDLTTS